MASDERPLLDGTRISALLTEVADELPVDAPLRTIVVVGGALLAWKDLRKATYDVDTVIPVDEGLRAAVAVVGARHGLAPAWLNDSARSFLPAGFAPGDEVVLAHPCLLVLAAPIDQVFIMKVFAGRAADTEDIRQLWPLTSFATVDAAAAAVHDAYPHEEPDPHLAGWISSVTS